MTYFGSDSQAENKPSDEQMGPAVREALPNTCYERQEGSDEDSPPAAQVVVQRRREPTAENGTTEVRC
jgi:hypothetical protein